MTKKYGRFAEIVQHVAVVHNIAHDGDIRGGESAGKHLEVLLVVPNIVLHSNPIAGVFAIGETLYPAERRLGRLTAEA